ncbi:VOC family protein [Streptomyces sp. GMY02]|uniref:VOC family protein n=1 Tax=Streptomyces sp. GMY02 TaxID=1333528 RepID=UPI001C2C9178|nr:VOC family protein [Streptomyces sp. GMY02]QXE38766.1 VOC family protein [Streptomyces sp. GMY02]
MHSRGTVCSAAPYTDIHRLREEHDVPLGEEARRLTVVVAPDHPDGAGLLLEPAGHPAVKPCRDALVKDGIPLAQFAVPDMEAEYERLRALGVRFTQELLAMDAVTTAVFNDTCGNLIQTAAQPR